jgi:A/G-specific adenine glycosylase
MSLLPEAIDQFQEVVWEYYKDSGRHTLPWRLTDDTGEFDPYKIMVSEIMLQQTQVSRVIPKYLEFISVFPTFKDLAGAPLAEVLRLWSGLGYNRRAKYLWQAGGVIQNELHGRVPRTPEKLAELPGIGLHTAGAIIAYSFNLPVVFIETNIRTVMLYHFFPGQDKVTDKEITEYVQKTLPEETMIREWYWALMDYGTYIKQQVGNVSRAAAGYTKQSRFEGSNRQLRGVVLRLLATGPKPLEEIRIEIEDDRLPIILEQLTAERMIHAHAGSFVLGV